jgi:hypothetical protein
MMDILEATGASWADWTNLHTMYTHICHMHARTYACKCKEIRLTLFRQHKHAMAQGISILYTYKYKSLPKMPKICIELTSFRCLMEE